MKRATETYRVHIAQVNQTYIDVEATRADAVVSKARSLWRKETACPRVLSFKKLEGGAE